MVLNFYRDFFPPINTSTVFNPQLGVYRGSRLSACITYVILYETGASADFDIRVEGGWKQSPVDTKGELKLLGSQNLYMDF